MNAEPYRADAGPAPPTERPTPPTTTTVRGSFGEGVHGQSIRRLAALSKSPPPHGALLLAEVNGEPVAAIGIFDGQAVADPTRSTFAQRRQLQLERVFLRAVIALAGV